MGMTARQIPVQLHTAPELEAKLNMPGFILWARENLIPNGMATQMNFASGGYRELPNAIPISDQYGLMVDYLLTQWSKDQSNPESARKISRILYECGMGDTSAGRVLGMHRSTVQNYRVSATNYLWRHRGGLGIE